MGCAIRLGISPDGGCAIGEPDSGGPRGRRTHRLDREGPRALPLSTSLGNGHTCDRCRGPGAPEGATWTLYSQHFSSRRRRHPQIQQRES